MTHYNPYAQQILDKGRDLPEPQKFDGKVPARFADRFKTYAEYEEAMADFLNGM
jgi:predicted oxidoreductase (fatty acid repression mutant protein)